MSDVQAQIAELHALITNLEDVFSEQGPQGVQGAEGIVVKADGEIEKEEKQGVLTFGGFWDREEEYDENEIVIFKNTLYVNMVKVPKFVNNLGPNLFMEFFGQEPDPAKGPFIPKGLIVPGYSPTGIITVGDPRWQDPNSSTETKEGYVKAHVWELIQRTPGGLIKVVGKPSAASNLGENGGLALYYDEATKEWVKRTFGRGNTFLNHIHEPGQMKASIMTDILNGNGLTGYGGLWDGTKKEPEQEDAGFNSKKYFEEHPAATHRFYIAVSGATKSLPGPPFGEVAQTLPWPYELTTEIENLVAEPGNLTPAEDPEHWLPLP